MRNGTSVTDIGSCPIFLVDVSPDVTIAGDRHPRGQSSRFLRCREI